MKHKIEKNDRDENLISVFDILIILAKQIKVIILVPSITLFFALIYIQFFAEPMYSTNSKIKSSSSSGGGMSEAASIASQFGISVKTDEQESWVSKEIIKSKNIIYELLDKKFHTLFFGEKKTLLEILAEWYGFQTFPELEKKILTSDYFIKKLLIINEDKISGIFTIQIKMKEKGLSLNVNNVLIEVLDSHQKKYQSVKNSRTKLFISDRISASKLELTVAENKLKDFRSSNRRIENSPSLQLEEQRLSREVGVLTSVFTTLKQQLETTKIEEFKDSDYVIIIDAAEMPLYPSEPNKKLFIIFVAIFSFGLGVMLALLINYVDNKNAYVKKLYSLVSILKKSLLNIK